MEVGLPRGTRDYSAGETIVLQGIMASIEDTFRRFGFSPIDTPGIELLETLNGKAYGEDAKKEIYVIEGKTDGLRYDFTVPLARHMAMKRDIPLPFKRYQIGKVWRMDEPQKMRAREFIQADVDVVGSNEPVSDAEIIGAVALSLEGAGVQEYKVIINSRTILDALMGAFGVPGGKRIEAIRALDKLEKIGREEVSGLLVGAGQDAEKAERMLDFVLEAGSNESRLDGLSRTVPESSGSIANIKEVLRIVGLYRIKGEVLVDFSLARGLDYYTGGVWEFCVYKDGKRLPSIASGGRYDRLMEMYSKNPVPAVGAAIGVSRVFEVVKAVELRNTYAKVHVSYIKRENQDYGIEIANAMRSAGIYTDLELTERALSKQLEYVNSMSIPYAIIVGNREKEEKKVKLRDMLTGEEEMLTVEEAVSRIKK